MEWLRDYGAFVAAAIAAGVTILNGVLQTRHDRRFRTDEWLRQTRIPRYVGFIRASFAYQSAILWEYAEPDVELFGPEPAEKPDLEAATREFRNQFAELAIVGPAFAAREARLVQYAMWAYRNQLQRDPWHYDQSLGIDQIDGFIDAAQSALGIPLEDRNVVDYRDWVQALKELGDEAE